MPKKISIEVEVSDSMINDIFVTALEQGIGYWALGRNTVSEGSGSDMVYISTEVSDKEAWQYMEDGDDEPEWWTVNADVIVKGIERIVSGEVGIRSDLAAQVIDSLRMDDCDIDADAADCIVQAGIFGELVYG